MRQRVMIVDGHSMIFQWPDLRTLHQGNTAAARNRLIEILARYKDAEGLHMVVVFDGSQARTHNESPEEGLQIFYAQAGVTADSIIERLTAKYAQEFEIIVATDDHLERTTISSFGASWISSSQLAGQIREARADLDKRLRKLRENR